MDNAEKLSLKFDSVSMQILKNARNELYMSMRYLDLALSSLQLHVTTDIEGIGTDGQIAAAHPKVLIDLYEKDRRLVNRVYLHLVVHCLLRHLFKRPRGDELLWRISCDIAAESVIDSMYYRCIRVGVSRMRMNTYDHLKKKLKVLTAEGIYRVLSQEKLSVSDRERLRQEFCADDHSLWPRADRDPGTPPPPEMEMLRDKWQDISEKTQTEMETFSKEASSGAGDMLSHVQAENRQRYDYKAFLRRFAVLREEMRVDPDTFDYVFYTFGLSMYGNMPLIEPQEYREVRKIEEFVIVIDVSMSTSGELVRSFLEQTYSVLTEQESYLRKVNIRVLQCDEAVRRDEKITCRQELDDLMENFELAGGGGTDFRPAFDYVRILLEEGAFTNLKGMIYFTDGRGTYPSRRPAWDTAFVFLEEDYTDAAVPPWAIKLILEKEQLEEDESLRTDAGFIWEEEQE